VRGDHDMRRMHIQRSKEKKRGRGTIKNEGSNEFLREYGKINVLEEEREPSLQVIYYYVLKLVSYS
jgi:hypothetical protein